MEEQIDLRPYIDVLLRSWRWILVCLVVAMVLAALLSHVLLPSSYEAVATVLAIQPRYQMALAPGIESLVDTRVQARAYAALAKNAQLQEQVIASMSEKLPAELRSIDQIDRLCSVSVAADPSVILLKVRYHEAQLAADIANAWARRYVIQINSLYGQSEDDVEQLVAERQNAAQVLLEAEQAVVEFQKANPLKELNETVNAKTRALAAYLDAETSLQLALQDARSLKQQLQSAGSASPMPASGLSVVLTQLNALAAQRGLSTTVQIQVLADASLAGAASASDQIRYLDSMGLAFEAKEQALVTARAGIPTELRKAQADLQQAQFEQERLMRTRDAARDIYLALVRKVGELGIALDVQDDELRMVSPAPVPMQPASGWSVVFIFVGGMVGLLAGIVGAFIRAYRRKGTE